MIELRKLNKTILNLFLLGVISTLTSCNQLSDDVVEGNWNICELKINGDDLTDCITYKGIGFNKNDFKAPLLWLLCPQFPEAPRKSKWKIIKEEKKYFLNFESQDSMFKGKHGLKFEYFENTGQFFMILSSDNFYMKCERLFGYLNYNAFDLRKIAEMTNDN